MYPLFDLHTIEKSLCEFQKGFNAINDSIEMRRESFTDTHRRNIVLGYEFLNSLLKDEIDLFSPSGLYNMVELNHIILCGVDPLVRAESYKHLVNTRDLFFKRIQPIYKWYKKKVKSKNFYELAAGYYSRALSFPQLFFEGNHRTENMIINYYLAGSKLPPYIVSPQTAINYLNISGNIKFSSKESFYGNLKRAGFHKQFKTFLQNAGDFRYLKIAN